MGRRVGRWKKYPAFALVFLLILALVSASGCGNGTSGSEKNETETEVETKTENRVKNMEGEIPDSLIPGHKTGADEDGSASGENSVGQDTSDGQAVPEGSGGASGDSSTGGSATEHPGGSSSSSQTKPSKIQVNITIESSAAGNLVSEEGTVVLDHESTAYDALIALMGDSVNASGGYVIGIGGLSEKDYGAKSGWIYSVNGVCPNKGSTAYVLKDGDTVVWSYTK